MTAYRYIRANGHLLGSNSQYVADEIAKAQRERAPTDAWSYSVDNSKWNTMADLKARADAGNATAADTYRKLTEYAVERHKDA